VIAHSCGGGDGISGIGGIRGIGEIGSIGGGSGAAGGPRRISERLNPRLGGAA
jgi:hypothetical protein